MTESARYRCTNCNYAFNRESYSNDRRCPYCSKADKFVRVGINDNLFREI